MLDFLSWGKLPKVQQQAPIPFGSFDWRDKSGTFLPRGLGRSYGDSCLNEGGSLLLSGNLNHFIQFNDKTGVLKCEAGMTFDEILKVFVPKGWFLPVTPGTKFVTVGGAIANDVHGKNHHRAGNFGNHVLKFELVRSSGEKLICSQRENTDFYHASIGGLGLTGFITWVELKMIKIKSAFIDQEQIRFESLKEFLDLSVQSESQYEYTVAWVDSINGKSLRGIFIRGNHASSGDLIAHKDSKVRLPFYLPKWVLSKYFVRLFNWLYYWKNYLKVMKSRVHYDNFFYPLDAINEWNKAYGHRGFYQYQFVVPSDEAGIFALNEIFKKIKASGGGSFLAVLKTFGAIPQNGMMSFPMPGITLALDFANTGAELLSLFDACDLLLEGGRGRVYPAKDARMLSQFFQKTYPLDHFRKFVDQRFSSSFSRRVHL